MFKIGEFSKLAQVSVHLLRHYDEVALLPPAEIDPETSYRYYNAQQLPRLNRILALRDMGLSLEQVRTVVEENATPEEIRNMFALKRAQLERSIAEDTATLASIEARLQRIDDGDRSIDYDITVKAVPELVILGLRSVFANFDMAARTLGDMAASTQRAGVSDRLGELVAVMADEELTESHHDLEMGFIAPDWRADEEPVQLASGQLLKPRSLPAHPMMATAIRTGVPSTAHVCRADIALWVERNNYELDGLPREVFLVPPRPGAEDQTVMEMQFPIRPVTQ